MSLAGRRVHVVAPHFNMRGGVIKLLDYADHAAAAGAEVSVYSNDSAEPGLPLFSVPRLRRIRKQLPFVALDERPPLSPGDLVLFTWPRDFIDLAAWAPPGFDSKRFIHLVQSTQHANVAFTRGYGRRLLRQPISRVSVSAEVATAIAPYVAADAPHTTIDEGHDWQYFAESSEDRTSWAGRKLRVGYTTWKSRSGDEVAAHLAERPDIEFRSIDHVASWTELRELYQWSDIFLAFPAPEEGFYMVGFEAMAAGALVAIPDVGGNRSYCRFGLNCLQTSYDDVASYVAAIDAVAAMSEDEIDAMRAAAYREVGRFDLSAERAAVVSFLNEVSEIDETSRSGAQLPIGRDPRQDHRP